MKITWSKKAKVIYITLKETKKIEETEKVSDTLYIDYKDGYPVGIKILGVEEKPIIE